MANNASIDGRKKKNDFKKALFLQAGINHRSYAR